MKKLVAAALLTVLVAACGPTTETEGTMIAWANVLNTHLATGGPSGDNYAFPHNLGEVDPALSAALPKEDAWGKPFHYRRIIDDKYQLISAGPDSEFGNDDDIVVENGMTYDPVEIYKKRPFKKK